MTRVGTCQDCGAKYKIPDSVKATKAKCKKCEGVVVIPALAAVGGAAAAAKPATAPKAKTAAPSKSAPSKRAGARSAGAKSGAKSSGRAGGSRRSGGSAKGKRSGGKRGGAAKESASPMPMILGIVALLLVGAGVWWFGFRDDPSSTTNDDPTVASSDDGTTDSTDSADDNSSNTDDTAAAAAPEPAAAAPAPADDTPDSNDDGSAAAAAAAPAETAKPKGPYDPVIVIEPVGPTLGTTADQLAEWEQKIFDTFIDAPHPKIQKGLIAELDEIDIVDLTPAIMNSLNGLDISDGLVVRDSFKLIEWWQKRTAGTPTFTWNGDASRTSQADVDLKIATIESLVTWWNGYKTADQERLDALRKKIEDRLATKG